MHPILFQRERLFLYLGAWMVIAGILAGLTVKSGTLNWGEAVLLTIPMCLVYAFICLTSFYLCRAFSLRTTGYARLFLIYIVASLLSSALWIGATRGWSFILGQSVGFPELTGQNENVIHIFFLNGILLFLLTVFMHYLMIAVEESRSREKQALEQSVLAREAELRALRAQIHPHFLFNSLNSISALTAADPRSAREMSIRLAEFLRKTLRFGAADRISLGSEIGLVEDYLAIEKTRFARRLVFRKEVPEALQEVLVPPLILQPLVENAINHGIAPLPEGGTIRLSVEQYDRKLAIRVENPVDPDYHPPRKGGVGIDNVSRRVRALHGAEGRLVTGRSGDSFVAEVILPMVTDPETGMERTLQ
ncbi:MAG: histidine kinase [Ignavibacteria bacterium]|nr:histidine kinase [Ignavibacteria bacterium]